MRYILTLVAILVFSFCNAQRYAISGKVSFNGKALKEATILLDNPNLNTETDLDGNFKFNGLKAGNYVITVFAYGFESLQKEIALTAGSITVSIAMKEKSIQLNEVVISEQVNDKFGITRLKSVEGVTINEGKKSEVILLGSLVGNKATNNARQIFSKVPGLNIWESDGAGVQLGIGGRGLSPDRSSNFNVRQNGYDISADALGYPESYYTPPSQAVKRIEIIRGAASLQYGTQFGGLVNFKLKDGSETEKFDLKSEQTVGSFGFLSTFNSIGGSNGKIKYYGYYNYKRSNGWRPNSSLDQHGAYATLTYAISENTSIKGEYTFNDYLSQQPGGLTDNEFRQDARSSNRERNWFAVNWNLFALDFDHRFTSNLRFNARAFGLIASRNAVGNLQRIDRPDDPEENRDLFKDEFNNLGLEARLIYNYQLGGTRGDFLIGTRYYDGLTLRRQGDGTNGSDANFSFLNPENLEDSDFRFPSTNTSVFIENIFRISDKLSVTPGLRFEYISTESDGFFRDTRRDLAGNILFDERIGENRLSNRSFVFGGIGISYKPNEDREIYANFSQNYRAVNFNDIRVNIPSLEVDSLLSDERGFNIDLGLRGQKNSKIQYDLSAFLLSYNDRVGTTLEEEADPRFVVPDGQDPVLRTFRRRSNVADAAIYGIELFAETNLKEYFGLNFVDKLNFYTNLAIIRSAYISSEGDPIDGNDVELVPPINLKSGIIFTKNNLDLSLQFTWVTEHFSDASNAISTPTAVEGVIPSYHVLDLSSKYTYRNYFLQAGINNLTNQIYFTRRAAGYPGPGIIPADGRSFYVTFGIDL